MISTIPPALLNLKLKRSVDMPNPKIPTGHIHVLVNPDTIIPTITNAVATGNEIFKSITSISPQIVIDIVAK